LVQFGWVRLGKVSLVRLSTYSSGWLGPNPQIYIHKY
jgi:hypothetical protein